MLKSTNLGLLFVGLMLSFGSSLAAQGTAQGIWIPSQTTGGGRATAVAANGFSNSTVNDGWRWGSIWFFNPLTVNAALPNGNAHGM